MPLDGPDRSAVAARALRVVPAVVVLVAWLFVAAGAVLPDSAGAAAFQHVALGAVTTCAALVTLLGALPGRRHRRVWLLLGLGLLGYAVGFDLQFWVTAGEHGGPGGLNWSDCASFLLYPLADAGLIVLARRRAGRRETGSLLEGGMVFCAAAAVAVAGVVAAYPTLLDGSVLHVVYALAYPVGGFTLLVVTLIGLSLAGGGLDRTWMLLLVAFGFWTVGDALFGLRMVGTGFRYGTYLDVLYTGGPVFVALAATCRPALKAAAARQWRAASALPALTTLLALALLVAATYEMVPEIAVWAAASTVVLAVVRTLQLFAQGRALERSREQARTDELTGLANRRALLEALTERGQVAPPAPDRPLELLLLDLDGFKEVNDSLGHAAGDALLALVGRQLRSAAPGCLVARLGGDEFAVVLPRSTGTGRGPALSARLRDVVGTPAVVQGTRVVVGASVGHGVLDGPVPGVAVADELLRRADVALYRAKSSHDGCVTWTPALDEGLKDRLQLLGELRAALASPDQIQAHYQPKADPRTGVVVGYEALARWQHPVRGLLLPGDFLPAVERAGLLPALTLRVLEQSVRFLAELRADGRAVQVAVNLSAPDLLDGQFPQVVAELLVRFGVPAGQLRLEVTETVVMSDPERIIATLVGLRELGVGLSLDDYGTGLSSLGYLRVLPVDELKIDRSFVRDLLSDQACALIVASTIGLAHDLRLHVVAEGVEDQPTLEALATAGVDAVQGWHTGRPATGAAARSALAAAAADALVPAQSTGPRSTGPRSTGVQNTGAQNTGAQPSGVRPATRPATVSDSVV